jgi:4-carboxymuconolactone decarboxylase
MARISPVTPSDTSPGVQQLLEGLTPADADRPLAIFTTLANHPKLLRDYLRFGSRLLFGGEIPDRDRELAILSTARRCGCPYEWDQHVSMARAVGVGTEEIDRIARDELTEGWSSEDAHLLEAVGELVATHTLSDGCWDPLAARYSSRQLLELTMLVGHYAMIAGMLNAARVESDAAPDPVQRG